LLDARSIQSILENIPNKALIDWIIASWQPLWLSHFIHQYCSEFDCKKFRKYSEKAKCWLSVREGLMECLKYGNKPESIVNWPLPDPGLNALPPKFSVSTFSFFNLLGVIAMEEGNMDEVANLYRQAFGSQARTSIFIKLLIEMTKPKAYQFAMHDIGKIRSLNIALGKESEYPFYISGLHVRHEPKRKLMEQPGYPDSARSGHH